MIRILQGQNKDFLIEILCLFLFIVFPDNLYSQITYHIDNVDLKTIDNMNIGSIDDIDHLSSESHMISMGPFLFVEGYIQNESDNDIILAAWLEGDAIVELNISFKFDAIEDISSINYVPSSILGDYPSEAMIFINSRGVQDLSGQRLSYCVIKSHSKIKLPLHASFQIKSSKSDSCIHSVRRNLRKAKKIGRKAARVLPTLEVIVNHDVIDKDKYEKFKNIMLFNPDGLEPIL